MDNAQQRLTESLADHYTIDRELGAGDTAPSGSDWDVSAARYCWLTFGQPIARTSPT